MFALKPLIRWLDRMRDHDICGLRVRSKAYPARNLTKRAENAANSPGFGAAIFMALEQGFSLRRSSAYLANIYLNSGRFGFARSGRRKLGSARPTQLWSFTGS